MGCMCCTVCLVELFELIRVEAHPAVRAVGAGAVVSGARMKRDQAAKCATGPADRPVQRRRDCAQDGLFGGPGDFHNGMTD